VIGSADVLLERNIIRRNNIEELTGYYASAVKIFNQSHRVTVRDNLVIDHPHSNGVWYDVGNRDGVIVNNWVEGVNDCFFFEISRGATVAGNVFVRCDKGTRVLNSADAHLYNNTYVDAPASFQRNERSKTNDHFGWHPATGPDVDEREGHVFVNNLLVASASYTQPLLHFEQPQALCETLTRPMANEVNGNVYVRPRPSGSDAELPLIVISPVANASCHATFTSLDALRKSVPALEAAGQQLHRTPQSIFKAPALGRYELLQPIGAKPDAPTLPDNVREALGWDPSEPGVPGRSVGAYGQHPGVP
jgi:hypothetical protein